VQKLASRWRRPRMGPGALPERNQQMTMDNLSALRPHDRLSRSQSYALHELDLDILMRVAALRRDAAHGIAVSYSRKVFIPLTQLCRDVCHYCTFAHAPRRGTPPYLPLETVLEIARAGAAAGCKEALFTLGDKPELR